MKISVIIPLRITDGVFQAKKRLVNILENIPEDKFNIIIIDYGTPEPHKDILKGLDKPNLNIYNFDTADEIFSIGHARDLGVQYAPDDVVMFNDIDFFANKEMYENIYEEVLTRNMNINAYDFFCVPVFFLTENGSKQVADNNLADSIFNKTIHRKIFESQSGLVDFPAYGSSAIVVNKNHYLAIGGHSREFFGHGAEDYDILHRLASYYVKGPRTADYYLNTKSNDIKTYRGFRAYFSLYGIDLFNKGMFFLHLWHPKRVVPGYHQTNRNFSLLEDLMKKFDQNREQPFPLSDNLVKEKTLVLIDTKSRTFKALRHALPKLGEINFIKESDFLDDVELINFIKKNKINRVLLLNPYGNEHRLSLYKKIKSNNIPFLVFDRGALPNSWFFDPNGFNYDSSSYHEVNWNSPLNDCQDQQVEDYIFRLRNSEQTLEFNSARKTARFLKEEMQIGNRKVLFVPFQRPTDTVTTHFAGAAKSVLEFQGWVSYIQEKLKKSEWVIICKNHPLDKDLPKIDGVIYAHSDTHIHDLIDMSDKVLLMNSGVGLISLAFKKPVICASEAFYCHNEIAFKAESPLQALNLINSDLKINFPKIKQFYWHLIQNIYSFGESKYKKVKAQDGSDRTLVQEIIFETINLGELKLEFGISPKGVSLDAPLFYSFGGREKIKELFKTSNNKNTLKATVHSSSTTKKEIITSEKKQIEVKRDKVVIASSKKRKLNKLFSSPVLFFKDAIKNKTH